MDRSAAWRRVAVITDIHANLPALEAALARIEELGIERRLLRRRPGRLRPASERGLRADRGARHPDDLRQLRLRDRARPRGLRLRVHHAAGPRARPASVEWTLAHTGRRARTSCARCRSTCASRSAPRRCTSSTAPRARSTSTCSRTSRRAVRAARRGGRARPRLRPHPQAVGPRVRRRAVRQLRLGRQAQGRRPARRLRRARGRRRRRRACTIERVEYDAAAVAPRSPPRPAGRVRRQAGRPPDPPGPPPRVRSSCVSWSTAQATPLTGRTAWARNLAAPVRDFLSTETGGAVVLLARDGRRAGVGELAVVGLLRVGVDHASCRSASATRHLARPARLGQRGADDAVLPRRRAGGQARARPRASCASARRLAIPVVAALGGMAVPVGDLPGLQRRRRGRARLGRGDVDRHRVRARRAGARRAAAATRAARVPAHARGGRRPRARCS